METTIMNNMCRCCASEGAFKDIKTTYRWMGEDEVYGDMLKDCFDITLSASDSESGICEVCITQLRNAANFKKQVLHTEEQFLKHGQNKLFKPNIVKVELPVEDVLDGDDNNLSGDDAFSGAEYELPIKTEKVEEPKTKKRAAAKASTSRSKKQKTSDGEDTPAKNRSGVTPRSKERRESSSVCVDGPTKLTLDKKLNFCSVITIRPVGSKSLPSIRERQQRISHQKRLTELDWHFDNIRTVLKCSNATPMRCRVGTRFACSYCLDQFQNPTELKNHTFATHSKDRPEFFSQRSLSKHIVYLDVTSLRCNICKENIDGLQELMDHLRTVHEELIHKQIKNQIVPFKYEGTLLCAICSTDMNEFPDLQDHMKEHYKNFLCVTRWSKKPALRKQVIIIEPREDRQIQLKKINEVHKHLHNVRTILLCSNATPIKRYGSIGYACAFCNKEFPEAVNLKNHTLETHDDNKIDFMENRAMPSFIVKLDITSLLCSLCNNHFENLDTLKEHLISVHKKFFHNDIKNHMVPFNFDYNLIKCVICKNEFNNFKVLLEHMNMHYRNYICEVCGKGFINKRILRIHTYRHKTGEFACTFCSKIFDTKVKQKEHERAIHLCLSKRSKCGYCGEKFTDYTKKNDHEVKVHGAKPIVLNCQACHRTFGNQRALTVHAKSYHMMERRASKKTS
ncbi:hypothetical protein O3G_MSEX011878 [Manduca sexta]|uniref:Uncharacterized protein n=1 Tax=Manduca sexta TaxID=7130 RepID=A0A921ZMB0_MANSE|nr:hypothetical protein O3G_MSEX011878 [Manduca sexta]